MFPDSSTSLAAICCVTGFGFGVMISLRFTAIGLSRDPDWNFGFMIMWIVIYGAIGFASMPLVLYELGLDALLVFWAILNVSGLAVLRFMPKSSSKTHAMAWSAIAVLFFYFLAQGVV